ncbi:hypothetical protein FOZ63_008317 [Perkinsus olseni]|uniref:RING-type domain-containing protein n=1 Tax=Perkinsus olseni TaxID=32597 RepID=A0A7J6TNE8_PEROL|nr:hypothetical protein FOZ60_016688 [Perkinsus olseni]KAF4712083.1 hypothetical protein FOZ63_008317 [Perkinsus olseni]KAF4745850.1 hypothetical protein FOZ62_007671 [Perkinsus olseni]
MSQYMIDYWDWASTRIAQVVPQVVMRVKPREGSSGCVLAPLECGICCNDYDDSRHRPMVLTRCGHSVCAKCMESVTSNSWLFGKYVTCPYCRHATHVAKAVTNYAVLETIVSIPDDPPTDHVRDLAILTMGVTGGVVLTLIFGEKTAAMIAVLLGCAAWHIEDVADISNAGQVLARLVDNQTCLC